MRLLFTFILLHLFCVASVAQQRLYRNYTVKDGLASNTVYNVLVDKKGFLWFATNAGVSRFDGTSFTNFSAKDGLADNDVLGMMEDNDGRIWFLCYGQRPCFYLNGVFFNTENLKELKKIKNYDWQISLVHKNEVWFTGRESVYRFKDNRVTEYYIPFASRISLITSIADTVCVFSDSVFSAHQQRSYNPFIL